LEPMVAAYARVQSYTARFVRQEVVDGTLRPREEALLKFQRPGRIYLRWAAGRPAGREILFVPGQNGDRMLVREPGLLASLATIVMAPDSPRVLEESRHPVTDIGIGPLIGLILDNAGRAAAAGDLVVRDLGASAGPEGPGRGVEMVLSTRANKGYYCRRLALVIGESSGLPVRAVVFSLAQTGGGPGIVPPLSSGDGTNGKVLPGPQQQPYQMPQQSPPSVVQRPAGPVAQNLCQPAGRSYQTVSVPRSREPVPFQPQAPTTTVT